MTILDKDLLQKKRQFSKQKLEKIEGVKHLIETPPLFKKGDIVVVGFRRKHIYDDPYWCKQNNQWIYPIDYGLGFSSEGYVPETLCRISGPNDKLLPI